VVFTLSDLKKRLEDLGVNPKKALGQNFLVNDTTCKNIVQRVRDLKPQKIVEVGPGLGALTLYLKELDQNLTLIELDSIFCEYWRGQSLEVIEADALKISWIDLKLPEGTVLVSNLPYQISSSIVIDRTFDSPEITGMVLMFQKEVAQRMQAAPKTKDFGLLSAVAQSFWDVKFVLEAGPKDFWPPPQIASRVLMFTRKPEVQLGRRYLSFLKAGFAQRRKLLSKNLGALYEKPKIEAAFLALNLPPMSRAEELSVKQFQDLFQKLEMKSHVV
jgi:16S rRNA (adenine1518-N6/adenine1519-N6)-dimethyltransferase